MQKEYSTSIAKSKQGIIKESDKLALTKAKAAGRANYLRSGREKERAKEWKRKGITRLYERWVRNGRKVGELSLRQQEQIAVILYCSTSK